MAMENKGLMDIPEEVFYGHIFPNLTYKELLRLRRISKQTKFYSDNYIRIHHDAVERRVSLKTNTFAEYIKCDLPTTHLFISNTSTKIFLDPDIPEFLQLYGSKITHLRVGYFETCLTEEEDRFYCSLPNLEYIVFIQIDARKRDMWKIPRQQCYFPPTFKNLKTLKLFKVQGSDKIDYKYAWDLIEFCTDLEYLTHPHFYKSMDSGGNYSRLTSLHSGPFGCVMEGIEQAQIQFPDRPSTLKYYDLEHFFDDLGCYDAAFLNLNELCYKRNIKLLNVDASLYGFVSIFHDEDTHQELFTPLVSLKNIYGSLFASELPNLESVIIFSTEECTFAKVWQNNCIPKWPKLKSLSINIDSDETDDHIEFNAVKVTELLNFLFASVERKELKELSIRFDDSDFEKNMLPCPRVPNIVATCKNLTKLYLNNWIGTNKALAQFWSGLPLLEEVGFKECKMLSDAAFVGKSRANPVFLKLKYLKKLSLLGMDVMTKVTDILFKLVFRKLKIQSFCMTSKKPIKHVTVDGIRSLLTGDFNDHVEQFPFRGWSLENVSQEEFHDIQKQFRSYQKL